MYMFLGLWQSMTRMFKMYNVLPPFWKKLISWGFQLWFRSWDIPSNTSHIRSIEIHYLNGKTSCNVTWSYWLSSNITYRYFCFEVSQWWYKWCVVWHASKELFIRGIQLFIILHIFHCEQSDDLCSYRL